MDPTLIEQVLINLLENAFVHSGTAGPIDLIICNASDQVIFTVRDYGVGISEKRLPYIFEGQQTSSENADGHKGIGIGLSICKTIIQAHGGQITARNHSLNPDGSPHSGNSAESLKAYVTSAPRSPGGAEFTFTLPKEKEDMKNA